MNNLIQHEVPNPANLPIKVCALYKFVQLDNIDELQKLLKQELKELEIRGILLIAHEGINGTLSGQENNLEIAIAKIANLTLINSITRKYSWAESHPFGRLRVRLKKEIVTIGDTNVNPNKKVGTYVKPEDWNELISDPDILLLDTRNDYEVEMGTFQGAIDPKTKIFREFPEFVRNNYDPKKHKKVAMFCTGGIRCEKASSFMLNEGYDEVYHLEGGILNYLAQIPKEESLWQGECFVFDKRTAVGHGVELTDIKTCFACRMPLTIKDRESPLYEEGVSCPKCHATQTPQNRARAQERHKQNLLSKARAKADKE